LSADGTPEGDDDMEPKRAPEGHVEPKAPAPDLRRFLHDVSAPLSAVALHLEAASRRAARGEDPGEALATARRELARAFELFDQGRSALLGEGSKP
jgi:hypothetical protein